MFVYLEGGMLFGVISATAANVVSQSERVYKLMWYVVIVSAASHLFLIF